jgi:antibiotic biosynthesis monooxygenase (ABM) superfamily enzyme
VEDGAGDDARGLSPDHGDVLAVDPISEGRPRTAVNALVTVLMVVPLTYVAMPLVTGVLRRWLYPPAAP